ncbi:testis anion transporter 1 isoform X8 [Grus americana]|uniref:testis anion transporter 1 isoform X8 n=1 Tax=Grus americana TaxID=9117 RepID=UPI0024088DD8|nr:testis anion transporter 1 isoform X8 [Grus americana]
MTQYGSGTAASRENYLAGRGLSLWGLQRGAFRGWESPGINLLRCKRVLLTRVVLRFCEITSINDPVPSSLTAKKLWSPAFGVPLFLTDCDQKENTALDNDTVGNYKQPSAYRVQREMQTEEHFQAYFERKLSSTLGGALQIPRENRRLQCSFSWGRFRKITLKVFPVLNWLFSYRFREWILRDLHAGLSVGMVQIPQGLLGVWLTRLPVPNINGFLSAFCCSMTYVIFGTSHHISVGSFSILNVVGTNILKTLNFNQTLSSNGSLENFSDSTFMKDYVEVLTLTASITFLTGIIQIITVTIISNRIHLHAESSSAVVSMIPQRFLPPTPPDLSNLSKIILHAFSLAIVSYFLLVFVGERYASPHNYHIASNQELIAVGLCNICSSFFKSFVVSCAISGTVIQEKTGGRTQLAAAIGASLMLVIALKLGHFFQMIPNGMLAAIVVFNVLPFLEKFLDIPILWRRDKYHFVIWLVTFAAVLCLGLEVGLAIAVGFTFFIITIRSHRMKMVVLGQIPNMNIYRSLSIYRAAREIEGIKIFQCCSSISFANVNHFKTYLLHEMDVKAVPLAESEVRAFVSFSLSDTSVERKDLKCSCVCDPPLPPPRIPYTEKLVKQHHADSDSSSSSVNLVHWSKYGDKLSSRTFLVGAANASSGFNTGLTTEKKEGERRRGCLSPISPIDNSSVQLDQEEQPMHLPCPVHTIILDFSMVQFVDLIGSELMRQIIHMFQNIGITVLIAGCHSSVIADFEKNDFFDSCVTKERFFLTLHDAVLAALDKHQKPDEVELTAKESAEEPPAEQQKGGSLLLKKNKDFFSAKTSDNKLLREEPISDTSFSAQNKAEPSSLQQYDAPPLQMDFQDPGWGKRWKYTSKS